MGIDVFIIVVLVIVICVLVGVMCMGIFGFRFLVYGDEEEVRVECGGSVMLLLENVCYKESEIKLECCKM